MPADISHEKRRVVHHHSFVNNLSLENQYQSFFPLSHQLRPKERKIGLQEHITWRSAGCNTIQGRISIPQTSTQLQTCTYLQTILLRHQVLRNWPRMISIQSGDFTSHKLNCRNLKGSHEMLRLIHHISQPHLSLPLSCSWSILMFQNWNKSHRKSVWERIPSSFHWCTKG